GEDWMAELASLYPLYPDIVRLEASILLRPSGTGTGSLVDAVHHFGASVLVHEIETTQQMTAATRAGADFLQGHALGIPVRAIEPAVESVAPVIDRRSTRSSAQSSEQPSVQAAS
ncbi:MAG: EAL domain-containing protein, partial [Betaproteobacteria bacterium]|nr:EAL domain-containing protein [Betaproteobacteria bacterium]